MQSSVLSKVLDSQNLSVINIHHKWYLPPYLSKRFLPILRTKTYSILFRKNSSYGTMIPTLSLEWLQVPNRQVTLEKTLRKHLFKAGKTVCL